MAGASVVNGRDADDAQIAALVRLADANRKTLGFLPEAVIKGLAREGKALIAMDDAGNVQGYALYELPHAEVRLIHLCVAAQARNLGVARQLIGTLSTQHADRRGIRLKCRRDYAANDAWPALGFTAVNEMPGRGKGTTLVVWWLDHGHPDLFSQVRPDLLVALDTDVYSDLFGSVQRGREAEESMLLHPSLGVLDESVALVRTTQLPQELRKVENDQHRQQLLHSLENLRPLPQAAETSSVTHVIRQALVASLDPIELLRDPSLEADALMVAAARAEGADCFATRDVRCRELIGPLAAKLFGFPVLSPTEVVILIDQLRAAAVYTPAALAETNFTVVTVGVGDGSDLKHFLANESGERKTAWRTRLRESVAQALQSGGIRNLVRSEEGEAVGLQVSELREAELIVPILRVRKHRLASSIGRQLVAQLREAALRSGSRRIRVTDPHLDPRLTDALQAEGFLYVDSLEEWHSHVLDLVISRDDLARQYPEVSQEVSDHPADLEHAYWPLKIFDAELPCYVVPIKPQFAGELLGGGRHLLERNSDLGLAREQVYYHAPGPRLRWPARILWYESGHVGAVTACSSLTDVLRREPDELYRRHARLGVYSRDQVRKSARGAVVEAMLFRDTEQLRPVPLPHLYRLGPSAFKANLQTITPISEELFMDIYAAGRAT